MATIVDTEGSASSSYSLTHEEQAPRQPIGMTTVEAKENNLLQRSTNTSDPASDDTQVPENDAFSDEDGAEIHYKTCKWYVHPRSVKHLRA
jgi:hypothetical protein